MQSSVNLYRHYSLKFKTIITIFSLKTQQLKVKLVAINIEFNSISAYAPLNFSRTLLLTLKWVLLYTQGRKECTYVHIKCTYNELVNVFNEPVVSPPPSVLSSLDEFVVWALVLYTWNIKKLIYKIWRIKNCLKGLKLPPLSL